MEKKELRLLIVEDDETRVEVFRAWTRRGSPEVKITWASSPGTAIGILKRDRGRVFDGVMLDHDLDLRSLTEVDNYLDGKDVADAVVEYVDRDVPIFIHSGNRLEGPKLVARLMGQGFSVEYHPFASLRFNELRAWLKEVADSAEGVTKYRRWKLERCRVLLYSLNQEREQD